MLTGGDVPRRAVLAGLAAAAVPLAWRAKPVKPSPAAILDEAGAQLADEAGAALLQER